MPFDNSPLITFSKDDQFFIKSFLIDASANLNDWRITPQALQSDLGDFVGKPFIVMDEGHPDDSLSEKEFLKIQNAHKIGEIIEVGIDNETGKAFAVSELSERFGNNPEDKERIRIAIEQIKSGEISFVSPSIKGEGATIDGQNTIFRFNAFHLAGVKKPAYGIVKAEIKGKCSGNKEQCQLQLARVQAVVDETSLENISEKHIPPCKKKKNLDSSLSDSTPQAESMTESEKISEDEIKKMREELTALKKAVASEQEDKEKEEKEKESAEEQKEDKDEDEKEKEVASLKKEVASLSDKLSASEKTPIVNDIIDKQVALNLVAETDRDTEFGTLIAQDVASLKTQQAKFGKLVASFAPKARFGNSTEVSYPSQFAQASVKKGSSFDQLFEGMGVRN